MSKKKKGQNKKINQDQQSENLNPESNDVPKTSKERLVYIFLSTFLFIISIVLLFYTFSLKTEISNLDENLTNCFIELDNTTETFTQKDNRVKKLEREIENYRKGLAGRKSLPDKYVKQFGEKGLLHPGNDIIRDLTKNKDIIPYKNDKGEKWHFLGRDQIYILSHNKVLAEIRDKKENNGWLLLKYTVLNDGKINWKIIDSYTAFHDK